MVTFISCSLILLSLTSLVTGESVDMRANGDTTSAGGAPDSLCDYSTVCSEIVNKSSNEWQQRYVALQTELESTKELLSRQLQDAIKRVDAAEKQSHESAETKASIEKLSHQLHDAIQRAEKAEKQRDEMEASNRERVTSMRAKLLEATEVQKSVENSHRECTSALDMVTEREQSFKQVTETHFQNFRKEIEDLTAHKNKTSNLEKLIDALNKDVDKRKQQLVDTRDTLTKEIQEHRATIRETSDKYTHTRQELFRAHERLRELEHQIATTHVNLTLIQKDVTELILHCWKVSSERALEGWKAASEAAAPHWAKLLEWLKVASYEAVAFYRQNVAPQVEKIMAQSKQQYKQHVQPVIDEKIYPVAKPILDPLREKVLHPAYEKSVHFHGVASVGLGQCSRTLTNYIELTEANESFAGARIYQAFKYTESNSEQVLTNSLWTILGIMVISFLLPRGQKNKLRKEKARRVKINVDSLTRKKCKANPTQ